MLKFRRVTIYTNVDAHIVNFKKNLIHIYLFNNMKYIFNNNFIIHNNKCSSDFKSVVLSANVVDPFLFLQSLQNRNVFSLINPFSNHL